MKSLPQSPAISHAARGAILSIALFAGLATGLHQARASTDQNRVDFTVVDGSGRPLEQAIVWAVPVSGQSVPAAIGAAAAIEQRNKSFLPGVLPVRVGTAVEFPNLDTVRHHVYSFSPAKVFSLKLYIGTPAAPVVFDKPGEVVLGCNIHDGMLGYVLALETPYFNKTDADGRASVVNLVPGDYELRSWHPTQKVSPPPRRIRIEAGREHVVEHRAVAEIETRPWAGATG